jgi:ABC-type antimicrobial peptide transport system permease subunit
MKRFDFFLQLIGIPIGGILGMAIGYLIVYCYSGQDFLNVFPKAIQIYNELVQYLP